jgi:hypothetical protein
MIASFWQGLPGDGSSEEILQDVMRCEVLVLTLCGLIKNVWMQGTSFDKLRINSPEN